MVKIKIPLSFTTLTREGGKPVGLRTYIFKRIIYMIMLLFFVITINFLIFQMMPGNPAMLVAVGSQKLRPEQVEHVMVIYGFREPLHLRYIKYVHNMLTWQFGYSYYTGGSVSAEMVGRLGNTLILMGGSTLLAIIVGVILGVIAAYKRGKIFDSASVIISLTTYSLPSFWMGMVFLLIFAMNLQWFPVAGTFPRDWAVVYKDTGGLPPAALIDIPGLLQIRIPSLLEISGRIKHLTLPMITLVLFMYGGYLLFTRASMLETLTEDYVVTAKAKGLKERTVLFKHALKNASLPIITNAAISFGFILSGAIITEQVFTYLGLGEWTWKAIHWRDYPVLQGIFYVIALCVIIANFVADLLYGVIDPRIRYE